MPHTIEIDFEVYRKIESERRGFDDPPLAALRRLLNLGDSVPPETGQAAPGRPWVYRGVSLEHGTLLKMEYNRRTHEGRIVDGRWLVEGQLFDSPSGAAGVGRTRSGSRASLDGWGYWYVKRPGSNQWVLIDALRTEH